MKQLEIDKAEVLQNMQDFNTEDSERASDAGESRQRIGTFLEKTGINNKAFSHCRMILRQKKDDKRQDWLRSMEALLPLMREQIAANGTRDAFDVPEGAKATAAELAADGFPDPEFETPSDDDEGQPEDEAGDPGIAAEAEEFGKAVDEALGVAPAPEGNVKKFKPRAKKAMAAE